MIVWSSRGSRNTLCSVLWYRSRIARVGAGHNILGKDAHAVPFTRAAHSATTESDRVAFNHDAYNRAFDAAEAALSSLFVYTPTCFVVGIDTDCYRSVKRAEIERRNPLAGDNVVSYHVAMAERHVGRVAVYQDPEAPDDVMDLVLDNFKVHIRLVPFNGILNFGYIYVIFVSFLDKCVVDR